MEILYGSKVISFQINRIESIFITLPVFTQATYANGYYDITYETAATETEEFVSDKEVEADFLMSDNDYGLSHMDATTGEPVRSASFRANPSSENTNCIVFSDPNASRMGAAGITFSGASSQNPTATTLDGKLIEIYAYKWGVDLTYDVFTDERIAVDEFKLGRCDAVNMLGFRAREFNSFTGSLGAIGAIPSYKHLGIIIKTLSSPKAAKFMRVGEYEVLAMGPAGAIFMFTES